MSETFTRRRTTPALAGVLLAPLALQACAPPPVRREPDRGPLVAEPLSVSPELERAPEQRQPSGSPARAAQREQAAATPDSATPDSAPPAAAAQAPAAAPPAPRPTQESLDDWWLRTPAPEPGRVRLVASATGQTLREARRAAVDQGVEDLREAIGEEPRGVRFELTSVQRDTPGRFRGYVLVSCAAPEAGGSP